MTNASIFCVCPVHNRIENTKKFVFHFQENLKEPTNKLIIVDDGSSDGTSEWLKMHFPDIIILKGDGNLWWSGAMNMGVEYALSKGADYVFIVNNDNILKKDALEKLVDFTDNRGFKIVGSLILILDSGQIWSAGGYFEPQSGAYGLYKKIKYHIENHYEVDWLPGMGTLIHRSVFDEIGFWDSKNFPQYHGDSDFTLRAKGAGIPIYIFPESVLSNDLNYSGEPHLYSFKLFLKSLCTVRSFFYFPKDVKFFAKHKTLLPSMVKVIVGKYVRYIGGFFWKYYFKKERERNVKKIL